MKPEKSQHPREPNNPEIKRGEIRELTDAELKAVAGGRGKPTKVHVNPNVHPKVKAKLF